MTAPASPLASATSYVRISSEDAPQQRRLALLGAALMGFASAVLILLTASRAAAVIPSAVLAQSAGVTGAAGVPALELAETIPHTGDWCAKAADFTRKTLKAVADRPVASLLKRLPGLRQPTKPERSRSEVWLLAAPLQPCMGALGDASLLSSFDADRSRFATANGKRRRRKDAALFIVAPYLRRRQRAVPSTLSHAYTARDSQRAAAAQVLCARGCAQV